MIKVHEIVFMDTNDCAGTTYVCTGSLKWASLRTEQFI